MTTPEIDHGTLYDYITGDPIGPATQEQVAASHDADDDPDFGGIFAIDENGDVVGEELWDAAGPGIRRVYTHASEEERP